MKKILIYISLLLVVSFVSCGKDNVTNHGKPQIKLSSLTSYFNCDGGSDIITVSTNKGEWVVENNLAWITHEEIENGVKIAVDSFDGKERDGFIYISVPDTKPLLKDSVYVYQNGIGSYLDLSADETANSYIVKPNTFCSFDATVRGNGNTNITKANTAIEKFINDVGVTIEDGVSADLLWEATIDGDLNRSAQIIENTPFYRNGRIYFRAGIQEGNAIIALKRLDGAVLWSWHIWVVEDDIKDVEGNGFTWMERNLGAINNIPGDIDNRGLLYQWGRKDPFLPTKFSYPTAYANSTNQEYNMQVGNGSGVWILDSYIAYNISVYPGNLFFSIHNPMTFIRSNFKISDWYLVDSEEGLTSYLWGDDSDTEINVKSVFDPCPRGYIVPSLKSLGKAGEQLTEKFGYKTEEDCGVFWKDNNEFFPLAGYIYNNSGLFHCANAGHYWTRTPNKSSSDESYCLNLGRRYTNLQSNIKSTAGSVRCVKEIK